MDEEFEVQAGQEGHGVRKRVSLLAFLERFSQANSSLEIDKSVFYGGYHLMAH